MVWRWLEKGPSVTIPEACFSNLTNFAGSLISRDCNQIHGLRVDAKPTVFVYLPTKNIDVHKVTRNTVLELMYFHFQAEPK